MQDYTGVTILVADDDVVNSQFVKLAFEGSGMNVLIAVNGKEAVESCRSHPEINLVFMDGMMPVMTGFNATREIRKFNPTLPVIMITAYANQASLRESVNCGCSDYISKPISPEQLRATVDKWVMASGNPG